MLLDEQIKIINSSEISEILKDAELTRIVLIVYIDLFECENPKFCARSISEYYYKIKTKTMPTKKYILKSGITIEYQNSKYNCDMITDEISKKLLKEIPSMAKHFDEIPKKK